jgi:hypothetical protein
VAQSGEYAALWDAQVDDAGPIDASD